MKIDLYIADFTNEADKCFSLFLSNFTAMYVS